MSRDEGAKSDHACRFQRDWKLIEMGAVSRGSKESRRGKKKQTTTTKQGSRRLTRTHARHGHMTIIDAIHVSKGSM